MYARQVCVFCCYDYGYVYDSTSEASEEAA